MDDRMHGRADEDGPALFRNYYFLFILNDKTMKRPHVIYINTQCKPELKKLVEPHWVLPKSYD